MNTELDIFKKIKKVDAPPFLFTRIQQKIENTYHAHFSKKTSISLALTLIFVVVLNGVVLLKKTDNADKEANIAKELNIMPNNFLYK